MATLEKIGNVYEVRTETSTLAFISKKAAEAFMRRHARDAKRAAGVPVTARQNTMDAHATLRKNIADLYGEQAAQQYDTQTAARIAMAATPWCAP